ncbi:MAG: hypothetical protein WA715_03780 [Candidatus Acidiferrum sp.]|jgi:hypothetical protein
MTGCRIPAGELDADHFADQTTPAITPDEIFRPHGLAVGQLDVNASVVLQETRHLTSTINRHDDGNVDAGQCQLAGQHKTRRTSSGDQHHMLDHRDAPICTIRSAS